MSAIVIPRMADKGKGAVVNIGSSSSHGFPMLTVYAATKAYVDALSQNLAVEYADKGEWTTFSSLMHQLSKITD